MPVPAGAAPRGLPGSRAASRRYGDGRRGEAGPVTRRGACDAAAGPAEEGLNRPMGEPRPLAARRRLRKCGSPSCPWCSGAALRAVHGCGTLVRRSQAADEELLRRQRLR